MDKLGDDDTRKFPPEVKNRAVGRNFFFPKNSKKPISPFFLGELKKLGPRPPRGRGPPWWSPPPPPFAVNRRVPPQTCVCGVILTKEKFEKKNGVFLKHNRESPTPPNLGAFFKNKFRIFFSERFWKHPKSQKAGFCFL